MRTLLHKIMSPLMRHERCARTLALSVCVGIYVAFSPFIGLHTLMIFAAAYLFSLNCVVMIAVSHIINNPWTMVPVYGAGHYVGDVLLSLGGIAHYDYNPSWIYALNSWAFGMNSFSFWGFMLGGNILGISLSIGLYPIIKRLVYTLEGTNTVQKTVARSKEVAAQMLDKTTPLIQALKQRPDERPL